MEDPVGWLFSYLVDMKALLSPPPKRTVYYSVCLGMCSVLGAPNVKRVNYPPKAHEVAGGFLLPPVRPPCDVSYAAAMVVLSLSCGRCLCSVSVPFVVLFLVLVLGRNVAARETGVGRGYLWQQV